jgi:hypothetical protein
MLAGTSYGAMLDESFGYDRKGKLVLKLDKKKAAFGTEYEEEHHGKSRI